MSEIKCIQLTITVQHENIGPNLDDVIERMIHDQVGKTTKKYGKICEILEIREIGRGNVTNIGVLFPVTVVARTFLPYGGLTVHAKVHRTSLSGILCKPIESNLDVLVSGVGLGNLQFQPTNHKYFNPATNNIISPGTSIIEIEIIVTKFDDANWKCIARFIRQIE